MHARMASGVLLALGCANLAVLNLALAPRLREAGRHGEHPAAPVTVAAEAPRPPAKAPAPREAPASPAPACAPLVEAAPDVVFQFGEERVPLSAAPAVRRVAEELRDAGARRLFVRGHADRLGFVGSNVALSWKRAEAVRGLLAAYGAPLDRIALEAVGDAEPADPTESPTGWARNRRVQLLWR